MRKSGEGVCCTCGNAHSPRFALCLHFTALEELFLYSLSVSFQNLLTLEESVKILKVGCACRVVCGEVDWCKPTLGCSGEAEG